MKKAFKIGILIASTLSIISITTSILTSCSKSTSDAGENDKKLKSEFNSWYNNLTNSDWHRDNDGNIIDYHVDSEQQALALYSWCSGTILKCSITFLYWT